LNDIANQTEPRWLRDLVRFLPLKSQFVLTGNVRDLHIRRVGDEVTTASLEDVLAARLSEVGYSDVVAYDLVRGFRVLDRADGTAGDHDAVFRRIGLSGANGTAPAGLDAFSAAMDRLVLSEGPPIALVAEFASRLMVRSDAPSPAEHLTFARALVLSQTARTRPAGAGNTPLFNTVVWVADKEGDLPDWLLIDNPRLRHIPISPPDRLIRAALAPSLLRPLSGAKTATPDQLEVAASRLVDETEGMLLVDLTSITTLSRTEGLGFFQIGEAIRRYKVGVTDDAWKKVDHKKIRNGAAILGRRVIGQDHAVTHMLDIIKRSTTGVGGGKRGGRPRGVAFLAGPTGVGKTELAKSVTELLFGDESSYIRFDMSEFSAEHADQRLIGAPPGYVGYDVGGELTNAIRERPFAVVLFDEIEKAHPRILDKFLQVLDDGVLTSGRGDRVYFSEALIIFTSNLGIYGTDATGARVANVIASDTFEDVQARVKQEIGDHFKLVLNRPEILNRIGENVIVFDFIRAEVASQIYDTMQASILQDAEEKGYRVVLSPEAATELRRLCTTDLSNGGRGIRNKLEAHLVNPLARALFDEGDGGNFRVTSISEGAVTSLRLVRE
jgi:hypothetical protein